MPDDKFKFGMPLFCAEWPSKLHFMIGGGGGTASTGIKNRSFSVLQISSTWCLRLLIAKYEGGVMSDQISEHSLEMQFPVRQAIALERLST